MSRGDGPSVAARVALILIVVLVCTALFGRAAPHWGR